MCYCNPNWIISLCEATKDDLSLLLAWRNHPEVMKYFIEQKGPIVWENHCAWWHKRRNRIDWMIVVDTGQSVRRVGSVNASNLETLSPSVGIFIGEVTLWGQGVAKKALVLALDWLNRMRYVQAGATIVKSNERSIRLFESVGFVRIGEAREGEWEYRKSL